MQDSGINVLWEGRNALRILEGLAVTLGVSAVSVVLSLVLNQPEECAASWGSAWGWR